jgi:hypothetical protein
MVAPEVWGPRLWRLLHGLADLSDRRDVYPLWNTFLKYTSIVIPCQKCQRHMHEYWTVHRFLPKGWERLTGVQVRAEIRESLHTFHNSVNERLGKPSLALVPLADQDRGKITQEVQALFEGLRDEWGGAHIEWKRTGALLLRLVSAGSQA